ncbi:MAG: hypothetical protein SFY69_10615 [Planctomycetota bacterium]|nr:hypothetical protein [Planctomycetota bacterium]
MGDNKDVRTKLEGQFKAYHEHLTKRDKYPNAQDKAFAQKTMDNVLKQIRDLNKKLPSPMACTICKKVH